MKMSRFSKSITEIIQRRYSCRTYQVQPLDVQLIGKLIEFLQLKQKTPFNGHVRFKFLEIPELDPTEKKPFGTYGFIRGAQYFVIGAVIDTEKGLEHFGYLMERLILFATDLGLGTCWVGGTLRRNKFAAHINVTENEIVPAITPVGYPSKKRSKVDRLAKWAARPKKRRPWTDLFFEGDCKHPLTQEKAGKYDIPLEMIRIAPSASNRQPWRVIKESDGQNYHFFIKRRRGWYNRLFSFPDFPRIDLGIAVCHFDLTIQEVGLEGNWKFMKPEVIAPTHLKYCISWISE